MRNRAILLESLGGGGVKQSLFGRHLRCDPAIKTKISRTFTCMERNTWLLLMWCIMSHKRCSLIGSWGRSLSSSRSLSFSLITWNKRNKSSRWLQTIGICNQHMKMAIKWYTRKKSICFAFNWIYNVQLWTNIPIPPIEGTTSSREVGKGGQANPFTGTGMDIFWNYTMQGLCFHIWLLLCWRFAQIYLMKYVHNIFLVKCKGYLLTGNHCFGQSDLITWIAERTSNKKQKDPHRNWMTHLNETRWGLTYRSLKKLLTFFSPSKAVGSSPVGSHSLMSWSRPLVARIGALGCGSKQFTWVKQGTGSFTGCQILNRFKHNFDKKGRSLKRTTDVSKNVQLLQINI